MNGDGQPKLANFWFSEKVKALKIKNSKTHNVIYNAPEVLENFQFSTASDIWAVGVVAFSLLVDHEPFTPRTTSEAVGKVKRNSIHFYPIEWKKLSREAYSFVHKCLEPDVDQRITALDALKHQWMSSLNYESIGIGQSANNTFEEPSKNFSIHLSNAEKYNSFNKLKLNGLKADLKGEKISKSGFKKVGQALPNDLSSSSDPFKDREGEDESDDKKKLEDAMVQKTGP